MTGRELSEQDKKLLDIFGKDWPLSGPKEAAIREATGLRAWTATQIVNALLDTEAALAYAPSTVNRLRRLRAQALQKRRESRSASRSASRP